MLTGPSRMWATIALGLVLLLVASLALPLVARWLDIDARISSEVLSRLVSWPVAMLVIGVAVLGRHREAIDRLIKSVSRVKAPGFELLAEQQREGTATPSPAIPTVDSKGMLIELPAVDAAVKQEMEREKEDLLQQLQDATSKGKELEHQSETLFWDAMAWKFQYANNFLVLKSKNMLRWLSSEPHLAIQFYEHAVSVGIQFQEAVTIKSVLQNLKFIEEEGAKLQITSSGTLFLSYLDGKAPIIPKYT